MEHLYGGKNLQLGNRNTEMKMMEQCDMGYYVNAKNRIAAVIRCRDHLTLEITEQASASFLKTLLGVISNAQ